MEWSRNYNYKDKSSGDVTFTFKVENTISIVDI